MKCEGDTEGKRALNTEQFYKLKHLQQGHFVIVIVLVIFIVVSIWRQYNIHAILKTLDKKYGAKHKNSKNGRTRIHMITYSLVIGLVAVVAGGQVSYSRDGKAAAFSGI